MAHAGSKLFSPETVAYLKELAPDSPIRVTSAQRLSPEHRAQLNHWFQDTLGLTSTPEYRVDARLIGGLKVRVHDVVVDGTLAHQLERARDAMDTETEWAIGDRVLPTLEARAQALEPGLHTLQVGRILQVYDGVAMISGLSDCMFNEMLILPNGVTGLALSLEPDRVGAVLFGDYTRVKEGDFAYRSGRLLEVPTGDELLGRVVDALGTPIDEKGLFDAVTPQPVEHEAPPIMDRAPIDRPLMTGMTAIDAMIPIGRGQRELLIGDRQTGKTTLAVDTILNQKGNDVVCVYVAIGQKTSTLRRIVERLELAGAMAYTLVVSATAGTSAAMQYIAPYAATAMAEYFMYRGRDVLIVYDDLSKQAVAYRELSLLLRRPPGREAYPGDIFYLHARLLERAAKLSPENGGGSLTALPIIETQFGDVSAYIPTNVISITDGQIFLEADLFREGQRPAVNVGISVSRVGGSAQSQAMKKVAGRLRIDLAQYRELAAFAQFSTDLDPASRQTLVRGQATMYMLRQDSHQAYSLDEQILLIYATGNGLFDGLSAEAQRTEMTSVINFFRHGRYMDVLAQIRTSGRFLAETERLIRNGLKQYVLSRIQDAR